jgi:dihydroorotate dehydrogenase (fumarate)
MTMSTRYMGLALPHPVVASASPLSKDIDGIRRLEDSGAAAIVLPSLFEEQILHEQAAYGHLMEAGADSFAEALSYFPDLDAASRSSDRYLELIERASNSCEVPIIASLNGTTPRGWTDFATNIEAAGATALELNVFYLPTDIEQDGREVENRYIDVLKSVRAAVEIPVAIKIAPYFSATARTVCDLVDAGADGIVLFNRFYQPDYDLDTLSVAPTLDLSRPVDIRLGLFWISFLYDRIGASIAASSGVNSATEVIKYLLAGADVVMTTSALLRLGPDYLASLRDELSEWMQSQGFASVEAMRGTMSRARLANTENYDRANYIEVLDTYRSRWG